MWTTAFVLLACALQTGGGNQQSDRSVEAFLETMRAPEKSYNNVEPSEGAYLRDLVRSLKAKRVLEIGTSTGYSGIWMALGLRETERKLITIEYNQGRHQLAVRHFAAVGLESIIEARLANAIEEVPKLNGPFDLVFLDAVQQDNLLYYQMVLPKVRHGGAIVAHNVKSHPQNMTGFLKAIQSDPRVKTRIVTPGWQGFSVSIVQ